MDVEQRSVDEEESKSKSRKMLKKRIEAAADERLADIVNPDKEQTVSNEVSERDYDLDQAKIGAEDQEALE